LELSLELGAAAEEDGWAGRESGSEAYWEEPILPPLLSEQTQRIEQTVVVVHTAPIRNSSLVTTM
jgi:hypothetical protein